MRRGTACPGLRDQAGDLLESDQIDAIYVATPPDSHMEYRLRAAAAAIAPGGLFDDLASHGLDLFGFLLGDYAQAQGVSTNQMGQYSANGADPYRISEGISI